jgi:hypothetical protein
MTTINLTSNTSSGMLEADFNQIKQVLQTGGTEAVNLKLTTPTDTTQSVVTVDGTQTLVNKTLTTPVISTISNTGTVTLPTSTDTLVGRATTDTLTNKTLTNPVLGNSNVTGIKQATFNGVVDNGNSGTSKTIDWTTGSMQKVTMTGNCTFTFTAPTGVSRLTLIISTGAGSFTGTFPTTKWVAATAPVLTTTASKFDIITFIYDGSSYYGSAIQNLS